MEISHSTPEIPANDTDRYYFLLGMIEGAIEAEVIENDNPLIKTLIDVLENSKGLSEAETMMLAKYKAGSIKRGLVAEEPACYL